MKAYLLVVALAAVAACGKKNDAHTLEHEAVALAKYYQPKVEDLDKRWQAIWSRGSTIPGNLPDVPELGRRLQEARETLTKLTGIVGKGPDGKSPLEKQAEAAADANKVDDLKKLVHDNEVALDRGVTVATNNIDSVESWIEQFDRKSLAGMTPATPAESPAGEGAGAPPAAEPAAPEAAPAPKAEEKKAEQPKAEQPKPAQPKAEQPKPAQPKAEQPKQPAPAQPKQPAPAPKP
jgi:hypothetical protein